MATSAPRSLRRKAFLRRGSGVDISEISGRGSRKAPAAQTCRPERTYAGGGTTGCSPQQIMRTEGSLQQLETETSLSQYRRCECQIPPPTQRRSVLGQCPPMFGAGLPMLGAGLPMLGPGLPTRPSRILLRPRLPTRTSHQTQTLGILLHPASRRKTAFGGWHPWQASASVRLVRAEPTIDSY